MADDKDETLITLDRYRLASPVFRVYNELLAEALRLARESPTDARFTRMRELLWEAAKHVLPNESRTH